MVSKKRIIKGHAITPGDVVRDTRNGMLYALSTEGYIYLKDGEFVRKYNGEYSGGPFTSKNCEKVNLG